MHFLVSLRVISCAGMDEYRPGITHRYCQRAWDCETETVKGSVRLMVALFGLRHVIDDQGGGDYKGFDRTVKLYNGICRDESTVLGATSTEWLWAMGL